MSETVVPLFDLGMVFDEYWRQGPSFVDEQHVEVVGAKGRYAIARYGEYDAGYPYRKGYKIAIIPTSETEYIIVEVSWADDTSGELRRGREVFVYIKGFGWWRFEHSDATRIEKTGIPKEDIPEVSEKLQVVEQ